MSTIVQRLASAVQHHEAGRLNEAEALYRGILQEAPKQAHALHLLGVLAHQAGRHHEAMDLINRALAAHGPHPVFHTNLSAVYLAVGLLPEAEAQCREALRCRADLPDAHNNLGVALRRQGRLEEAVTAFQEALRLNPRHLDALAGLGATLHRQGRLAEALACLQEAARLAPSHAQAQSDLGAVLLASGHPEEAVRHLREAVHLQPDFAEAYSILGSALRDLGQLEEGMNCFRESLRINPAYARARNNLGYTLEVQGKIAEALAEFRETVRLEPENAMALASLSNLALAGHYRLSEVEIGGIHQLAGRSDLPLDDLSRLHFALARLSQEAGEHAKAFAHCRRANDLRKRLDGRRGLAFDPAGHRRLVDQLIAAFTPAYFARVGSFGLDSELPIFIVGMLRSGTTLAEQILASHPEAFGAGELPDLGRLIEALPKRLGGAEAYPECVARLDAATARSLGEAYLQKLEQWGGDATRVVDKLPFNFLHLGIVATLFPRARIIHCRRNPADTCLSCFFQNFADPHPFALDLRHLGQFYVEYERLMAHWTNVLPVPIFELRYEDLTAHQETTSRRLLAFCGLEWNERCLRFNETQRVVRTASTLQVRRPMYRSAVGRWQLYEAQLQPLLEVLKEAGIPPTL